MKAKKKLNITHELKYLKKFDTSTPDVFHKIYFELTKTYLEEKKVLNIGCWTGNYETMFKKEKCQVTSIDLNFQALQIARSANPYCDFLLADVLKLPFKKQSFDVVTFFTVLEHLPPKSEEIAFREINGILKQNGLLVITTPSDHFVSNILDISHWLVGHRHYKVEKLKEILNNCGFKIEKMLLKGGFWTDFSIVFFYLFKYLCGLNIYKNRFVERILRKEYAKGGYRDIFLVCRKQEEKKS